MATFRLIWRWIMILFATKVVVGDEQPFQCHELYEYKASETPGDMYSPFYLEKGEYPNGLWCEYKITAPAGYRIKLTFKDLDIEPSSYCSQDYLAIYANKREYQIATVCGSELPPPIVSNWDVNYLHFLFYTDPLGTRRGFHIQYEAVPAYTGECPGMNTCGNRRCYKNEQKCDGVDDCGDGTDEEGCNFPVPTSECGSPQITPATVFTRGRYSPDRIIGGREVVPGSWPWQISLQYKYSMFSHTCGGSLLNAQWVVTAAHCFRGNPVADSWRIHVGKHHKFLKGPYEQIRYVERLIIWPDLTGDNMKGYLDMNNDIALVKLKAPVKFNKGVQPVCLPELGWEFPVGTTCYATGWGETRGTGSNDALKQVDVAVMSSDNCSFYEKTQICVKNQAGFQSTCQGDSGGPLVTMLGNKWYLLGADSFGTESNMLSGLCAMPTQRTVFTKIADKVEWIRANIKKYS